MRNLQDSWIEMLKCDLEGFADPHTEIAVDADKSEITALWMQRGRDRSESFRLSPDGDFRWNSGRGELLTYRQFLSAEADFSQLASAILRAFPVVPHYVSTGAGPDVGLSDDSIRADDLLAKMCFDDSGHSSEKTRLLFLKGDAGSGKTTLLREAARKQARKFLDSEASFIYLYVSAQGRALSNLRDALSGELDDLRAGFTRDAVPALVRQGLIVPIIDGFDELLGAAGYGDAFGSLYQFLEQLTGSGAMVVSARSSFYDVEFLGRTLPAAARSGAYEILPITLLPWGDGELYQYLAKVRGRDDISPEDRAAVSELAPADRELLAKPFFADLFVKYADGDAKGRGLSLSDYLVDSYVGREVGKITDRDRNPLLDVDGHMRIFEFVAETMWEAERRDCSASDLRTVAELVAGEVGLTGDSAKQLVTKITSYAGFQTHRSGNEQRFKFEHEVYFDYFLSAGIRRHRESADDLGRFLNSGQLPEEVVASVIDSGNASEWLTLLMNVPRTTLLQQNRRLNVGTICAACFRVMGKVEYIVISSCVFQNTPFGDTAFRSVEFRDCKFIDARLEDSIFEACRAIDCIAESLTISGRTKLGIDGLVPGENLYRLHKVEGQTEIYSPSEMREALGMREQPPRVEYSKRGQNLIHLLQRILQKFRTTNIICLEDDRLVDIFQDESWNDLHRLLLRHTVVLEEQRQASGPRKTFLRCKVELTNLTSLEDRVDLPDGNLGDFWRSLRAL